MRDEQIIELYFVRNESAITETSAKYGAYCMKIAMNILHNRLDSEECTNDTWLSAWRSIPPQRPSSLSAYLGKITRNLSINRYKLKYADKRAVNEFAVSLDELSDCVSGGGAIEETQQIQYLGESISRFLHTQKPLDRRIFVCRYFYCDAIAEMAEHFGISESRVKSILFRMRSKLKQHLHNECFSV